jgi:hypothetical protein
MTQPEPLTSGPSRVLGPQRVRRSLRRVMATEKRHNERLLRDLRKLEHLVGRCLRLRALPRAQLTWCQSVYDQVAVCLVTANTVTNDGPTSVWAATCVARVDQLLKDAAEFLPYEPPDRTQRKRR